MFGNTFLTRLGGLKAGVIVVPFLLAGACQDGSRSATPTGPAFSASSSSLPHINITELPLPVTVNAALTATDCSNSPGPNITLDGFAALGGFGVEMTFSNNLKSTTTSPSTSRWTSRCSPRARPSPSRSSRCSAVWAVIRSSGCSS